MFDVEVEVAETDGSPSVSAVFTSTLPASQPLASQSSAPSDETREQRQNRSNRPKSMCT